MQVGRGRERACALLAIRIRNDGLESGQQFSDSVVVPLVCWFRFTLQIVLCIVEGIVPCKINPRNALVFFFSIKLQKYDRTTMSDLMVRNFACGAYIKSTWGCGDMAARRCTRYRRNVEMEKMKPYPPATTLNNIPIIKHKTDEVMRDACANKWINVAINIITICGHLSCHCVDFCFDMNGLKAAAMLLGGWQYLFDFDIASVSRVSPRGHIAAAQCGFIMSAAI